MPNLKICSLAVMLVVTSRLSAQSFGDAVTGEPTATLTACIDQVKLSGPRAVVIDATIREVCQKKGCWMVISDGGTEVRVTFKDYGFFVPLDGAGKVVRVQGEMLMKEISENEARHFAEDEGKSKAEIDKIIGPQKIVAMLASGVRIKE